MKDFVELKLSNGRVMSLNPSHIVAYAPSVASVPNEKGIGFHDGTEIWLLSMSIDDEGLVADVPYKKFKSLVKGEPAPTGQYAEAAAKLRELQSWRRGEWPYNGDTAETHKDMPYSPQEFGQLIDTAISVLERQ